jgi:hypothetical protein
MIGTVFNGGFGQSNEDRFEYSEIGAMDFDFDRYSIDSQQALSGGYNSNSPLHQQGLLLVRPKT